MWGVVSKAECSWYQIRTLIGCDDIDSYDNLIRNPFTL